MRTEIQFFIEVKEKMGRAGVEPATLGLRLHCSNRRAKYSVFTLNSRGRLNASFANCQILWCVRVVFYLILSPLGMRIASSKFELIGSRCLI